MINTLVQGTLLWIGMRLIQHNQLKPGVLLAFMLYQSQLQNEVLSLMNSYTSLIKSSGAGDKVFALLDRVPPPPGTGSMPRSGDATGDPSIEQVEGDRSSGLTTSLGDVVLENISFHYPSRPQTKVLKGIDMLIPEGQTVALVGQSGCGKSTIVRIRSIQSM